MQTGRPGGMQEERLLTLSEAYTQPETRRLPKGIYTQHKYDVFTKFCKTMLDVQGINEK